MHFTDGKGTAVTATITDANPNSCLVKAIETVTSKLSTAQLTIACAPTKSNDRFEWLLEKATEIGIRKITPLLCERSERKVVKQDRLNKVLIAAMKQSNRYYLPQLGELIGFEELVNQPFEGAKYIAHCMESNRVQLTDTMIKGTNALVLIGPEGDFTETEINLAINNGFTPVALGSSRLRTETAAIVSCTIFNMVNHS